MKFLRTTKWPWIPSKGGVWLALKRKTTRCSIEAALLSLAVHLALLFFCGSSVLLSVITKQAVAFKGHGFKRDQLPQRVEQIPVKVQKMQRTTMRPLMVRQVVRAASNRPRLPVPPPPRPDFDHSAGLERPSLSRMRIPGRLDIGVSKIDFFGTKSKGEKIIFILDASKQMMEDAKGGYNTYRYAKDEVHKLIDGMPSATLFNVMAYSGRSIDLFRPKVVPATPENRAALKKWLAPINSNPYDVGRVAGEYRPSVGYDSYLGPAVHHWLKAVQAAMEQSADSIFVLCGAAGRYSVPSSGGGDRGGTYEPPDPDDMAEYREKMAEVQQTARKIFEKENEARRKKGLPPKMVYNWTRYMIEELRLTLPDRPSGRLIGGSGGSPEGRYRERYELVTDHIDAVCSVQYVAKDLKDPTLNFVYLIARDARRVMEYDDIVTLRRVAEDYDGEVEMLRGAKVMRNLTY